MISHLTYYPYRDFKQNALKAAKEYLWYSSETNIGLALHSSCREGICVRKVTEFGREERIEKIRERKNLFQGKHPSDFIICQTKKFFKLFGEYRGVLQ